MIRQVLMDIMTACLSDIGILREINQDSVLIEKARFGKKSVVLATVCDGLGGLQRGEAASAALVFGFSAWFHEELPLLMASGLKQELLEKSWCALTGRISRKLADYGKRNGIRMGTTCTAVLTVGRRYTVMNIGDSRTYLLSRRMLQLTEDQTWCQREVASGRMTREQAKSDPRRNILLQCIGAGTGTRPDFVSGRLRRKQCMLLCSDGFFHRTGPEEMYEQLGPAAADSPAAMRQNLIKLTDRLKERQETDNISAVLLKTV